MQNDNEREYKSAHFTIFCQQNGIRKEFIMANNPQQNEVSKPKSITLMEGVLTMLQ